MSRRDRKRKGDDVETGSWMDTYADTITLLLTFFILLYSISAVDSKKLSELSEALKDSLSGSTSIEKLEKIEDLKVESSKDKQTTKEDLVKKVNKAVQDNNLQDVVKVREEDRGIVLQLDENILYDSGRADLKNTSINALDTITKIVNDMDNDVLVEGHTDNVPIHNSQYASNWELSTARAVSVVRYFVENKDIPPTRFAVKGYAEFRPLLNNDTPENRSVNRRVDILIVDKKEKANKNQEKTETREKEDLKNHNKKE